MIKLFGISDTTFTGNGDVILKPLRAIVTEKDNDSFVLDIDVPLEYNSVFTENRIIVAPTPKGDQAFRIKNVKKTRTKLSCKCKHIFYDSENYLVVNSYSEDKTCNYALNHFNEASEPASPYTVLSDITTTDSIRIVRKSLHDAFATCAERYGGHYVRDNWNFTIRQNIGVDNGVVIRYGKNLKSISAEYKWDNVVTKLLPVGKDGLTLPEVYLTAPISYPIPFTKTVSFPQSEIERDNYQSDDAYTQALITDLRKKAMEYLINHSVPEVNYTVSAEVERITGLGDRIHVIDELLGISLMTTVISYQYDALRKRFTQLQFGNFKKTVSDLLGTVQATVTKQTEEVQGFLEGELKDATSAIWNAMQSSHVIYDTDKILVVDRLPKEDAVDCMVINSGGIGFSTSGINGTFNSCWSIDGTLNMQNIHCINFSASSINTGTLDADLVKVINLIVDHLRSYNSDETIMLESEASYLDLKQLVDNVWRQRLSLFVSASNSGVLRISSGNVDAQGNPDGESRRTLVQSQSVSVGLDQNGYAQGTINTGYINAKTIGTQLASSALTSVNGQWEFDITGMRAIVVCGRTGRIENKSCLIPVSAITTADEAWGWTDTTGTTAFKIRRSGSTCTVTLSEIPSGGRLMYAYSLI